MKLQISCALLLFLSITTFPAHAQEEKNTKDISIGVDMSLVTTVLLDAQPFQRTLALTGKKHGDKWNGRIRLQYDFSDNNLFGFFYPTQGVPVEVTDTSIVYIQRARKYEDVQLRAGVERIIGGKRAQLYMAGDLIAGLRMERRDNSKFIYYDSEAVDPANILTSLLFPEYVDGAYTQSFVGGAAFSIGLTIPFSDSWYFAIQSGYDFIAYSQDVVVEQDDYSFDVQGKAFNTRLDFDFTSDFSLYYRF